MRVNKNESGRVGMGVLKRSRDGYANVDRRIKNGKSHGIPELIEETSL